MSRPAEIQPSAALEQAIQAAPADGSKDQALTKQSAQTIAVWSALDTSFRTLYSRVTEHFTAGYNAQEKKDALNRYLTTSAIGIAADARFWPGIDHNQPEEAIDQSIKNHHAEFTSVQALAGIHLLSKLMSSEDEQTARRETFTRIQRTHGKTIERVKQKLEKVGEHSPATSQVMGMLSEEVLKGPTVEEYVAGRIAAIKDLLGRDPSTPVVRVMARACQDVEAFCKARGERSPLTDLTIGDVNGEKLPPAVRERMGLDPTGPKALAIARRAHAYEMQYPGIYRYDIPALGMQNLRSRFVDYAVDSGLYSSQDEVAESMIGAAGSQAMQKAFLVAKKYAGQGHESVVAYFPNPGLRMVATMARTVGLTVQEVPASKHDNFFPNAKDVDSYLGDHPEVRIFINTPVGNPNGAIAEAEEQQALMEVLEKHNVTVINDLAYLGTGDTHESRRMAQALGTYNNRIDVIPMTKIFGRPGLRCASAMTPNEAMGKLFSEVAQNFQPSESYAMQTEALAIWDLVNSDDRRALADVYQKRQLNLISYMTRLNQDRKDRGEDPILAVNDGMVGGASLYVYAPLAPGFTALRLLEETGLAGVPAGGFNAPGQGESHYVRFSIGVEEPPVDDALDIARL